MALAREGGRRFRRHFWECEERRGHAHTHTHHRHKSQLNCRFIGLFPPWLGERASGSTSLPFQPGRAGGWEAIFPRGFPAYPMLPPGSWLAPFPLSVAVVVVAVEISEGSKRIASVGSKVRMNY